MRVPTSADYELVNEKLYLDYKKNTLLKTLAFPMSSVYGIYNRASCVVRQREATARICAWHLFFLGFFWLLVMDCQGSLLIV